VVTGLLREAGALLAEKKIEHSYPHCWRCHKPTIFRGTEQWFIGMDRNGLRERALEAIKKIKWMPAWGEERISNMVATRPDWCISRQRTWGVPIVGFHCEGCGELLKNKKALDGVVAQFARYSADVWYEKTADELLGGVKCGKCGGTAFKKESDILDVWLDSGSSHLAVLTKEYGLEWPSDMYLEGGDQYRGWFHSSLLVGVGLKGGAPYRECATNGWTLDGEGRAMSKSVGNVVEPEKIVKQYGAELLRLWVASVEFHEDVRISETILTRLVEAYRKLRNTLRYALGNLNGFDPERDAVEAGEMEEIDQWMLLKTEQMAQRCRDFYTNYAFHRVYQTLYNFATTDLSAVYFDVLKDRLYTSAPQSKGRRSAQTALYRIHVALVRLLAPILTFTSEEAWGQTAVAGKKAASVHLTEFPEAGEVSAGIGEAGRRRAGNWDRLMAVRDVVLKSLETARQEKFIGAPLEAKVHLKAGADLLPLLEEYAGELPGLFITSQVELEGHAEADIAVHVERADGEKCARCWKYTQDTGFHKELPGVCRSCAGAVAEIAAMQGS
jgi:isoleucyl-tRNA synthetase